MYEIRSLLTSGNTECSLISFLVNIKQNDHLHFRLLFYEQCKQIVRWWEHTALFLVDTECYKYVATSAVTAYISRTNLWNLLQTPKLKPNVCLLEEILSVLNLCSRQPWRSNLFDVSLKFLTWQHIFCICHFQGIRGAKTYQSTSQNCEISRNIPMVRRHSSGVRIRKEKGRDRL